MHNESHCFCSCFLPWYQGHKQPGGSGGLLEIPAKLFLPFPSLCAPVIPPKESCLILHKVCVLSLQCCRLPSHHACIYSKIPKELTLCKRDKLNS